MLVKLNNNPFLRDLGMITNEFTRFNREIDRAFKGVNYSENMFSWQMEDDTITISAEIPGYSEDNLDVALEKGNLLSISGEREVVAEGENVRFLRHERRNNSFRRSLKLPFNIDADGVKADLSDGILTLTLPRAEEDKPRQIAINNG